MCAPDASRCVQRWGTAEERPGESEGAGTEGVGVEGQSRISRLDQTSSRFPGEACSLSHLLLVDVRGDDAGPSGQEGVQAGRTFF